ncbi:MAG: hypothetical protein JNM85_09585 [Chthonomonas sp.]|nr:hypothetical protein [Chthonomonas sp.]
MNFGPEFFVPLLMFGIPIVAILTNHQRRMAEIVARQHQIQGQPQAHSPEIQMLRSEISELKDLVRQQMIMIDGIRTSTTASIEPIREDLKV